MEINAETIEFVRACNALWKYVNKGDGDACWLWTGSQSTTCYGQIRIQGTLLYAHRATFMLENGFVPESVCVLHRCDTPLCVRPSHLFAGTKADNTADMIAKGRQARGAKLPHSKLSAETVGAIKQLLVAGTRPYQVANMYGLTQQVIGNIKHGRIYAWVKVDPNG
jgi:hypothetical protein